MKNKEKFAKEIVEIACDRGSVAVSKAIGEPVYCKEINCRDCLLNNNGCRNALRRWAESEYIEKPVIGKRDRAFLEYIREEYKYIARDKNGELFIYEKEPRKSDDRVHWNSIYSNDLFCLNRRFSIQFPMVKWSDEEPWLIEDLKKLEVVEDYD